MADAPQMKSGIVTHTFRVRYAETDAMGIVHHANYLVWMEMGRTEFMRHFGFTYRELEEMGVLLPVVELGIKYKQSARYDDEIRISTWVEEMSRVRLRIAYKIERVRDGALLTEAFTVHTYMDKEGRLLRVTNHPEAWARMSAMVERNA